MQEEPARLFYVRVSLNFSDKLIIPTTNAFLDSFPHPPFFKDGALAIALFKALEPITDVADVDQAFLKERVALDHVPGGTGIEQPLSGLVTDDDAVRQIAILATIGNAFLDIDGGELERTDGGVVVVVAVVLVVVAIVVPVAHKMIAVVSIAAILPRASRPQNLVFRRNPGELALEAFVVCVKIGRGLFEVV